MQIKKVFHCWKKSTCIVFNNLEDLLEEGIAVNKFFLMLILQLVRLDVLPERRYDDRPAEQGVQIFPKLEKISPCLGVHPKQPGQPLIQLELKGEQKSFSVQEK